MAEEEVVIGSGNVFEDLELSQPDARLAKASLVLLLFRVIKESGLSQTEVAKRTGVPQPRVSTLMKGKSQGFSTDRLLQMLNALGQDVDIIVRPTPKGEARPGRVLVV